MLFLHTFFLTKEHKMTQNCSVKFRLFRYYIMFSERSVQCILFLSGLILTVLYFILFKDERCEIFSSHITHITADIIQLVDDFCYKRVQTPGMSPPSTFNYYAGVETDGYSHRIRELINKQDKQ